MTLQTLIDAIVTNGDVRESDAHQVMRVYRKVRAFTVSPHDGYVLKSGAFLDRDVIRRALGTPMEG